MLGDLLSESHSFTIADMEAGLEHLSRSGGTLRHIDLLLVVVEPYRKAVETARRTLTLARELGIPRIYGVGSKVADAQEEAMIADFSEAIGLPMLGNIPFDEAARAADRAGDALLDHAPDSDAVEAIARLLEAVEDVMRPQEGRSAQPV